MQVGAPNPVFAPNPLQVQQAVAPIAETGSNDLQSPADQRVEQAATAETAQSSTTGRGQVIDIFA
ncbi:MAG: hypothetical protein ABID63_09695 [Pseudomonadota bacterium]